MSVLPTFEKLDVQLRMHQAWIKGIPWYCEDHNETHSQAVLEDVLENTHLLLMIFHMYLQLLGQTAS